MHTVFFFFFFFRVPVHMKQNVSLSILTPFSSKSAKKIEGATQKTNWMRGPRGVWKLLFYVIRVLYPFYQCWSKYVCFWGQGIHFLRFWKNTTFCFFSKILVLRQIKPRGRFCGCTRNLFNFWCYVEWKIDHAEVHSENLSNLHLLVWPWV